MPFWRHISQISNPSLALQAFMTRVVSFMYDPATAYSHCHDEWRGPLVQFVSDRLNLRISGCSEASAQRRTEVGINATWIIRHRLGSEWAPALLLGAVFGLGLPSCTAQKSPEEPGVTATRGIGGPRLELEEAVERRELEEVRGLLAGGADPSARGALRRTALHYAARPTRRT